MNTEHKSYCDNLKDGNVEVASLSEPALTPRICIKYTTEIAGIDSNYNRLKGATESYEESVREVKSILARLGK